MTRVRVEFYGVLQQAVGRPELDWPASEPLAVEALLAGLAEAHSELWRHLPRLACALNNEIVPRQRLVQPGDTLALLPPVSGG